MAARTASEVAETTLSPSPPPPPSSLPPGLALSISRVLDEPAGDTGKGATTGDVVPVASSSSARPTSLTARLAKQFADPSSLSALSLDRTQAQMRQQLTALDADLDSLMATLRREQAASRLSDSSGSIQLAIKQLFAQLQTIRAKAASSESTVREITGDIRTLDTAKKNLVGSITALKRLQMLEDGAQRLQTLTDNGNFREAAEALQAAKSLQQSFQTWINVERVSAVWRQINQSQQQLKTAAMELYEKHFLHDPSSPPIRATSLPDAAIALDAIGSQAVVSLLDWYCTLQLREYRRIFRATDEAGQLDNVARRFAWFRRVVKQHEEEHAAAFLPQWNTARALTGRFADVTREDLKSVLVRERSKLQVSVLLEALGATLEFEQQNSKRLNAPFSEIMAANPKPITAVPSGITLTTQSPADSVSSVFEPYLSLFVDAQDKALAELMTNYRRLGATIPRPSGEQGEGTSTAAAGAGAPDQHHTVLPSSTELFYFYRQTLEQCARLSNREPLRDLFVVFRRYLRAYADDVLRAALFRQDLPSTMRRSTSTDNRNNVQDLQKWCLVLNTAEYCANTCQQLEQRVGEKIHPDFREGVSLSTERDGFLAIVSATVQVMTRELEFCLDPAFHKMMRPAIPWSQLVEIHGKSEYTDDLAAALEAVAVVIRQDVENKRYLRNWCDKVVHVLTAKFTNAIVRLKPISKTTAEQLMIDLYEVRTMLLALPQFSPSETASASGTSYSRYLDRTISRIESLLRIVVVPATDHAEFIDEYARLIGDRSFSNFQKVLELKGLRRGEMNDLIEDFVQRTSSGGQDDGAGAHGTTDGSSTTTTSFLTTLDMDPPHGPLTPQPTLESSGGGGGADSNPSSAPYAVRNASGAGVRSPDRSGALSPANAEGGIIGGRVFGTGKFSSIFGGLGRRGDDGAGRR